MNKECNNSECPKCNEQASCMTNCGFYNCIFSIKGQTEDRAEVEQRNIRAPKNELLSFHGNSDSLRQWHSLIITTVPDNSGGCAHF